MLVRAIKLTIRMQRIDRSRLGEMQRPRQPLTRNVSLQAIWEGKPQSLFFIQYLAIDIGAY